MSQTKGLSAISEITIDAPPARVWQALTDPAIVRQYLFGTEVTSDWTEGSPVRYRGTWEGKAYEDKGVVEKVIPEQLLVTTYWSSLSGTEDKPENYATVSYALAPAHHGTRLRITQDNCPTEESRAHSEKNWGMVLKTLKKILEQP